MESSKIKQLDSIAFEFEQLHHKIKNHIDERTATESFVYADTYRGFVGEHKLILMKYNNLTGANLSTKSVFEHDLSSTKKTVKSDVVNSLSQAIRDLATRIRTDIASAQNKESPIPPHQMRVCFKVGTRGCPNNPIENKSKIFVAMPFDSEYMDSYTYGIKLILDQKGLSCYRADAEITNKDIMCKICEQIQTCGKMIVNISGLNPNVMLELGLAYGLGKEVIVIKDKKTTAISDLGSIEYIEYAHAGELQAKLNSYF